MPNSKLNLQALSSIVQYINDQFQSTGYVIQFEVVPDAFVARPVQVIFQ